MANENDGNLRNNNNETDENLSNAINKDENSTKLTTSNNKVDYRNIRATSGDVSHAVEQQPRREENPFSFKHFLNRDTNSGTTIIGSATISNSSNNLYNTNNSKNSTSKLITLQKNSTQQQQQQQNIIPVTKTSTINVVTTTAITTITGFNNSSNNKYTSSNNNYCNELNLQSIQTTQNSTINNIGNLSNIISNNLLGTITTNNYGTTNTITTSYQTSTGARPKVPQSTSISSSIGGINCQQHQYPSTSISTTSMSSLINAETSKMKRSPRFSSFDSQASLAEYAGSISNNTTSNIIGGNNLYNIDKILKDAGQFLDDPDKLCSNIQKTTQQQQQQQSSTITNNGIPFLENNYDKMYVPRSYSNYDMDLPIRNPTSFNSGRLVSSNCNENNSSPIMRRTSPARPNRLSGISSQQSQSSNMNHHHSSNTSSANNNSGNIVGSLHCRPNSEFAAALPDFVQDHWMDHPWYYNEMHLNSPPNSPNRQQSSPLDFVCDHLPAGMANPPGLNCSGSVGGNNDKCQTLPDFLSDGPIIHSSARLADVAVGLPNLDSPEDNSPTLQLSRIRLENERLRRELDESRISLAEQTRRSGDLERLLDQARSNESAFNRTLAQNIGQVEENLDQSKKRTAAAQNLVSKLKQQVKQLTAEIELLKRENESLREEGAVGGSDRTTENIIRRPSRTQQLSRDLLKAASTAENNLRQLLLGVENLRLMAASIENIDDCIDYNQSKNTTKSVGDAVAASVTEGNDNISSVNLINEEFLSDCDDDFDDFSGPAL